MVVREFITYWQWLGGGLLTFALIVLVAVVLGIFVGYLVAAFRHGPTEAFYIVSQVVFSSLPDFLFTSPKRIFAIAKLAVKEALRRKVILVTAGIFAAMLLFGGWFMGAGTDHPDRLYINFVLWGTQMLVLLMGMLISAFSLPEDIKHKTIYTVVTKPVRPTEVILGRIVGFGFLGTVLLAGMGLVSFLFVWRGLSHQHQIVGKNQTLAAFQTIPESRRSRITEQRVSDNAIMEAVTNKVGGHFHHLELTEDIFNPEDRQPSETATNIVDKKVLEDGRIAYRRVICNRVGEHSHQVFVDGTGDDATIRLGPAIGYFRARVPIYASKLQFYDRTGEPTEGGINVGNEWTYRGYIDGGHPSNRTTLSKAEFNFDNFTSDRFRNADVLQLELTMQVFRTFKADIEKRVTAGLQFESVPDNPETDNIVISDLVEFETEEFSIQQLAIDRKILGKIVTPDGKLVEKGKYDLFETFAKNGKFRVNITCRDLSQYLGIAKGDVYFRAGDQIYWFNFFKGYIGIWCQMMVIIALGVALSTFLSSPITMLGTIVVILVGFVTPFIREMADPQHLGGGPIESAYRVITQQNMMVEFDTGFLTTFIEQTDKIVIYSLYLMSYLAPNFAQLDFSDFLTYGFAINSDRILVALTTALAFVVGLTVVGYFALKTREIAK